MNRHFLFIAISLMAVFSCSLIEEQDVIEVNSGTELVFEATIDGDIQTKTAVQSDGTSVWWNPHEKVNIFFGDSESSLFTSTNDVPAEKVQFRGTIEAFTGEVDGNNDDYFWAIYPYSTSNTSNGSSVTATLSANQTACAGTFADNQWLTVARSKGLALSFRAVCAGFRFSVTKPGIKSVTFKGNNNEILAGKARIAMDADNLPYVQERITGERVITLSAPAGKTLEVGKLYYMTFFPNNFTKGFTVTLNTETETGTRVYGAKDFKRTDVHRSLDFDKDIVLKPALEGNLVFEDANFKAYCVNNFDTNRDGEISYEEAKSVKEIDVDTKNITSLKGIEYFTDLESLICSPSYSYCIVLNGWHLYEIGGEEVIGLLTSLDLSKNTKLKFLKCDGNQLTSLSLSANTELESLSCQYNYLKTIFVSNNSALLEMHCKHNQITGLDVSSCVNLQRLDCYSNQLTSLDTSNNTALTYLSCYRNQLVSVDVSSNLKLSYFSCQKNPNLLSIWMKKGQTIKEFYYDSSVSTVYYKN